MSELGPRSDRPQRVVTVRALLAGVICSIFISVAAPFSGFKMKTALMAMDFSVPAAVFTMFALALFVNLFRLVTRRSLLSRGEMLVAYSMMAVTCGICTMGLTGYLVPMLGTPEYYKSPENKWASTLLPEMPKWLMLSPEGAGRDAIRFMYEGFPTELTLAQKWDIVKAWIGPLWKWSVFLLALYATSICLMAIFRKQWVEDERIVFPLAQLPMELAGEPGGSGERIAPFFKSRLLWIGFAIPFAIACLSALPVYFPYLADIKPRLNWRIDMLEGQWKLPIRVSWQTIGLAYLLSADVALCVWSFGLLGSFYHGLSNFIGFKSPEKLGIYGAAPYPDLGHFGMGAMIALVLLRLWIGRRHLIGVVKKALFMKTDVDDTWEPMSYRTAFWGSVLGFVVMTVWLHASGFSWLIALFIMFGAFIGFIGLTRIIAESGVPVSIVPLISSDFVVSAVGTSVIGKQGLLALPWTYVWNGDVRTFVMCSAAHGMRACSERRRSYRGLFFAMMTAVIIAMVVSVVATLNFAYEDGGANLQGWFFDRGPRRPFEFAAKLIKGKPRAPSVRGWVATGVGAGAMVAFTVARHTFVWWPLNPVGLPISVVAWTRYLWFNVLLAWLIKSRFLKYGGPKLYLKMRPFFLGLVLGHYSGAAFWVVVHAINGVTGNLVFSI